MWTLDGTLGVVIQGTFAGLFFGIFSLPLRRFLGRPSAVRGLLFGGLLLAGTGSIVLEGSYEFSRFVAPSVSVPAFAALFLVYGVVLALVADAIAPRRPMRHPRWRPVGSAVLAIFGLFAAWQLVANLRFHYGF